MKKLKLLIAALLTLAMAFSVVACAPKKQPKNDKVLKILLPTEPASFSPLIKNSDYMDLLFLPLVEMDNNNEFQPMLASEITTSDNQLFTIKLNKVSWSDGKPVTADDVIFTMELFANKLTTSLFSAAFNIIEGTDKTGYSTASDGSISGVTKINDRELTVKTKTPITLMTFYTTVGIKTRVLPKHVLKDVAPEELNESAFFRTLNVTDGAFLFVEHVAKQYVKLEANPNFYKGEPLIKTLYLVPVDKPMRATRMESGELDMTDSEGNIAVEDYDRIKNDANLVWNMENSVNNNTVVFINCNVVPDARVRRAINLAIDRAALIKGSANGYAENSTTHFIKNSPYYCAKYSDPVYDPEQAKALLKEAGWDSNTVLKFTTSSGSGSKYPPMIVEMLKQVGVKVELVSMDFPTLLSNARKHDFEMITMSMSTNPMMSDFSNVLASTGSFNCSCYSNPEMDELLKRGLESVDENEKKEIYAEVQRLYAEDSPVFAIYQLENMLVRNKRVTAGESLANGMYINPQLWDVAP